MYWCPREREGDNEAGRALFPPTQGQIYNTQTRRAEQTSDRNQSQPIAQ